MALLAFLVSWLVKKDPAEQDPKPFKTFMSKGKGARKRKLSSVERGEEEDLQRQTMIRKSLASRTSTHRASTLYTEDELPMHDHDDDDEDEDELDNEPKSPTLKNDWKAYEADLQRNRSVLIRRHPGIDRSGGSSSDAPLSPLSSTPSSMASPIIPAASPQASPATRHHTFHTIPRKPVASSPEPTDGQSRPGVGRATTLA